MDKPWNLSGLTGDDDPRLIGLLDRPQGGFTWQSSLRPIDAKVKDRGPWLIARRGAWERYPALRNRELVDKFVALGRAPSQDAILSFADKYGRLGEEVALTGSDQLHPVAGESFGVWRAHAVAAACVMHLWGRVEAGDRDYLRPFVQWDYEPRRVWIRVVAKDGKPDPDLSQRVGVGESVGSYTRTWVGGLPPDAVIVSHGVLAGEFDDPVRLLDMLRPGDPVGPLSHALVYLVNRTIRGEVARKLVIEKGRWKVRYVADSLKGVIYLGLQDYMAGGKRERLCGNQECEQKWFVPNRRDQKYCSDPCRWQAAYRQQERRANP